MSSVNTSNPPSKEFYSKLRIFFKRLYDLHLGKAQTQYVVYIIVFVVSFAYALYKHFILDKPKEAVLTETFILTAILSFVVPLIFALNLNLKDAIRSILLIEVSKELQTILEEQRKLLASTLDGITHKLQAIESSIENLVESEKSHRGELQNGFNYFSQQLQSLEIDSISRETAKEEVLVVLNNQKIYLEELVHSIQKAIPQLFSDICEQQKIYIDTALCQISEGLKQHSAKISADELVRLSNEESREAKNKAENDFTKKRNSNIAYSHFYNGTTLYRQGQYAEAEDEFREAVSLEPRADYHNNLGMALFEQGKYEEGEAEFRESISLKPRADYHNNLGMALFEQGKHEEGEAEIRKAISLNPSAVYRNNLGMALSKQGKYEEGEAEIRKAISLNPSAIYHKNLGMALFEQGKYEEGEAEIRKAIRLDPNVSTEPKAVLNRLRTK